MATSIPRIGQIIDGYRFNGGDPSDPASWARDDALRPGTVMDGYRYLGGDAADKKNWQSLKVEEGTRSIGAVLNDTMIEIGNAVAGGAGAIANFASPGNRFSQAIEEFIKSGEQSQSDVTKAAKAKFRAEVEGAEGLAEEAGAAARYALENPLLAAGQAAGSFALPGGAIKGVGKLAQAAGLGARGTVAATTAAGSAIGGAMAGGDAAGEAYELVYTTPEEILRKVPAMQELLKEGTDFEDARRQLATQAAREASVLPAIVGGVSGAVGLERVVGGKGFTGGVLSRAVKGGLVEGVPEAFEEGLTSFEARRAASQFNPEIDPLKGVGSAAALGGILGAGPGAAVSALDNSRQRAGGPAPAPVAPQTAPSFEQAVNELEQAVDPYVEIGRAPNIDTAIANLGSVTSVDLTPPDVLSLAERRAAVDRNAELLGQANQAGTEFDRRMALEQAQIALPEAAPRRAEQFVDLKPMEPLEARQRLAVLQDQLTEPLTLQIVPHPSAAGKAAIARVELPVQAADLELPNLTPAMPPAVAQNRIESAALAGQEQQRRAEDAPRQDMVSRVMANIEARGGVASPYEAEVLRAANMGQPFNRINPSLGRPASADEKLTAATGVAVGQEAGLGFGARESTRQQPAAPAFEYTPDLQGNKRAEPAPAPEVSVEQAFVQQMRETNTPAARAFVKDYEAGRISDTDVSAALELQARLPQSTQQRIEGAAAQAQPTQTQGLQVELLRSRGVNPALAEAVTMYGNRPLTAQDLTVEGATSRLERAAAQAPAVQSEGIQVETGLEPRGAFLGRDEAIRQSNQAPAVVQPRSGTAEFQGQLDTADDIQTRLEAAAATGRLAQPSSGRIVTSGATLSTKRNVAPGATLSINDGVDADGKAVSHQVRVVDPSAMGSTGKMLTQVGRIFGKKLVAFESDTLAADGFVMDDDNESIYINTKSQISPLAVFGHEMTHLLKRDNAEAYKALEAVVQRVVTPEGQQSFQAEYGQGANLEELTSDLVGNRFREESFWADVFNEVAAQNPEGARGIITRMTAALTKAVNAFLKVVRQPGFQADQYVSNLNEVKAAVRTAFTTYAKQQRMTPMQAEGALAQAEAKLDLAAGSKPFQYTPKLQGNKREMGVPLVGTEERVLASRQRQTETPEFQRFYEGSQIRDNAGQPVVLYRGMRGEQMPDEGVESFTPETGLYGTGIYMSSSARRSEGYTKGERGQMYPVFAAVKNPIDADEFVERFGRSKRTPEESQRITDQLVAEGYDGVVERGGPGGFIEVMAFRPEQVKSATGNQGSFDAGDARITKSTQRKATTGEANEPAMRDLLAPRGMSRSIGQESGRAAPDGIAKFTSPFGSTRYVYSKAGKPLAVVQVMSSDGKSGRVVNAYTDASARRQGLGAALVAQARQDFKTLDFSDDLSPDGAAFVNSVDKAAAQDSIPQPSSKADIKKAEVYEERTGERPYTSEGQLEVPLEGQGAKFSVKRPYGEKEYAKGRANDPLTGLPLNKNGTVTLYFPTSNAVARELARTKKLTGARPNANRIYLTNESSGPKVMNEPGNIDHEMDGANVLLQVDPRLLHLDKEYEDGRKDFFIPIAEGQAFKTKMTKLFTLDAPRTRALSKETKLTDLQQRIGDAISEYLQLDGSARKARLEEARRVLKEEHNVGTLLGVNGKLEKTNTGGYGLNNYNGKDVMSMGLGLASAQKINEKNLSTCPNSAICEGLCLGETSGQNLLYGGEGQFKSGPRLAQYLKTEAMVLHPEDFAIVLHSEIEKFQRAAAKEDYQPTVRLNVTSDFRPQTFEGIINAFPGVMFYDYTKLPSNSIAPNHHLTYSSTGASQIVNGKVVVNKESNWDKMVDDRLTKGMNVAMAFTSRTAMPKFILDERTGQRFQVWDGDNYDARFLDPKPGQPGNELNQGMIVGLTNKDKTTKPEDAAVKHNGFFLDYDPDRDGDTLVIKNQKALAGGGKKTIPIAATPANDGDARITASRQRQTDTPEFKRWFGDSKAVVAVNADTGQPLVSSKEPKKFVPQVMYHTTRNDFSEFEIGRLTKNSGTFGDWETSRAAVFVTPELGASEAYGKSGGQFAAGANVMPLYVKAENPLDLSGGFIPQRIADRFDEIGFNSRWLYQFDWSKFDGEEGKDFVEAAKKLGYDSVIFNDENPDTGESFEAYALFSPTQLKSATGNSGEFDPENPDITKSRRRNILGQPAPLATWAEPAETKLDDVIYVMQDKLVDTKRVVEAIKSAAGNIDDKWNPYLQEELFHGRSAKQTKDFLNSELRPLIQDMQARGVDMAELEEYLHNRHAEERNIQIAKVNPGMPDGGSGIDTADARAFLAALDPAKRRAFEALAQRVDRINKGTRDLLVASGLETQETIDKWDAAYSKYVPLFREDLDFASGSGQGTGQGYNVRGPSSKRATGSRRNVVDIMANVAMQRERAIVRAEKARVAAAVYGLAVQNPNTDFWLAIDPAGQKDPAKAMQDLIRMGIDPADAQNIIEEPTQNIIDPRTGLVVNRVNPLLRSSDNVLAARINGEEKYVFFNANDERAQRMVTALKNLDADQLGRVMSMTAAVTRYFAAINTQYNPIFGAVNFLRDVQGAAVNLTSTPLGDRKKEVMAGVIPALRGIYSDLRSQRDGKGPAQGVWAGLWEEFQREGGQTGFRDMFSRSAERGEALQRMLDPSSWADSPLGTVFTANGTLKVPLEFARQKAEPLFDWLSDYNETMENAVRLSAYKAGLDKGLTKEQAASIAKNLTVNFNRKGQVATQAGALYAFFNASVQGTARLAETLKGPAGKKIMAGGLLLGTAQAMLLAAAGFDQDEPPDFIKERNLIIPLADGKFLQIPMPLGLNVIPNTSRVLTEWAMSGFKDTGKRVAQITGAFLDMFNPIGNAGWSMQTLAPTVVDPLAALAENRDWTGKPIAKEDRSGTAPTPGYTRAKETASWLGKEISYYLNLASGGTKYKPGALSPTPDQIDYLIGVVTGGVGREALKVEQTARSAVTGEELPPYKVPLLGRFYGDAKAGSAESTRFYANITRLNEHEAEIKGRRENREDVTEYLRDNPEARLVDMADRIEREVQELKRKRRELVEKGAPAERVKMVEERIKMRMKQLNDRVRQLREPAAAE